MDEKLPTDWRASFNKYPLLMIGAAVGGGILLGAALGSRAKSIIAKSGETSEVLAHGGSDTAEAHNPEWMRPLS